MEPSVIEHELSPQHGAVELLATGLARVARHVALLAACLAVGGSLFFSEVMNWPPCELCWYQRILMYPLAVILAVGILRRDTGLHWYVLPLSLPGIGLSLYHYLLIKTDWFPPPDCLLGIPCDIDYIDWLGFINIPFMALTAFVIISVMMITWALLGGSVRQPIGRWAADRLAVPLLVVVVALAFVLGSRLVV